MTEQEARDILGLGPDDTLDSASTKIAVIRKTLATQIASRKPGDDRDAKIDRQKRVEQAVEALGGLSLEIEEVESPFKATPDTKSKTPLFIAAGLALVGLIAAVILMSSPEEVVIPKRDISLKEKASVESYLSSLKWPQVEEQIEALAADNVKDSDLDAFRLSLKEGREAEKRQKVAFLDGEVRAAITENQWKKAKGRTAELRELDSEYAAIAELETLIEEGQKKQKINYYTSQIEEAILAKNWQAAESALAELVKLTPDTALSQTVSTRIAAGRKKQKADMLKSQQLTQQALAIDTGAFSAAALTALQEAMALNPQNTEAAALLKKMSAYTRTLRVPTDFPTIAEALAEARPRDEVVVGEGVFAGAVDIAAGVRLRGAGFDKTIITCIGTQSSVATVTAGEGVTSISGLTLQHRGFDYARERYPVLTVLGGRTTLTSVKILKSAGHGVVVRGGGSLEAINCRFSDSGWSGISVEGDASRVTVENSRLSSNLHNGIQILKGASATVSDCQVDQNTRSGAAVHSQSPSVFKTSRFMKNRDAGVTVAATGAAEIQNCQANSNGVAGLVVHSGSQVGLTGSQTSGNGSAGIILERGARLLKDSGNQANSNKGENRVTNVIF